MSEVSRDQHSWFEDGSVRVMTVLGSVISDQ